MAWSKREFVERVTKFTAAVGNNIEEGIQEAKELAPESITTAKIKNEAVTASKLSVGTGGSSESRIANTAYEPSATEAACVYLTIKSKAESTSYEVIADTKAVYTFAKEVVVAASENQTYFFRLKAGAKWEVKVNEGTLTEIHSVYQSA